MGKHIWERSKKKTFFERGFPNVSLLYRFDTDLELIYYAHGGILNYMVRKLVKQTTG